MANEGNGDGGNPFDLLKIKQLVKLMRDNDLAEIDLRAKDSRVRLRRGPGEIVVTQASPASARPPAVDKVERAEADAAKPAAKANAVYITSPIVGTFYASANPDSDPFVRLGSKVGTETTVCIIEAMKVFNEIPAGVSGTIAEVLVENGSSVEFGQPLFRVDP